MISKIKGSAFTSVHCVPKFCSQCSVSLSVKFIKYEKQERLVCGGCGYIAYLNPVTVAGTIPVYKGKILLLKRGIQPQKGKWTFPAGFVELGESAEDAAVRETWEETGIKVKIGPMVGAYSYRDSGVTTIVYVAAPIGGKIRTCRESSAIKKFAVTNIPWQDLAFRSSVDALKDWLEKQ